MAVPVISIQSHQKSPRLEYVVDFIFRMVLGCEVIITDHINKDSIPVIAYGTICREPSINIVSAGLLFEKGVRKHWLDILTSQDRSDLFIDEGSADKYDFKQDLFSLIFFFISRYEEYLPYTGDSMGRFCASESLAYQKGVLQIPIVDNAIRELKDKLEQKFDIVFPQTFYQFGIRPTIDIDQMWAFHRKLWKNLAASFIDFMKGHTQIIKDRWKSWLDKEKDPFHTWELLEKVHNEYKVEPIFFILVAPESSKLDKNHNPFDSAVTKHIQNLSEKYKIGLHPSSQCNQNINQIIREKNILENILGKEVDNSRMHYLLIKLPDTYRMLIRSGIRKDFSMGFHDAAGYRAGTGHDFLWYDLELEKATELLISPFQLMDVTLKVHMKMKPEQALRFTRTLIETAKHYNSPFTVIWHNSSFYDKHGWVGWEDVYAGLIRYSAELMS